MCPSELPRDEHYYGEIIARCPYRRTANESAAITFWVACMSLQEGSQRRLVNRKQAHLVRVAFYGLTDSNSISREPEEDEFLSFGLIE